MAERAGAVRRAALALAVALLGPTAAAVTVDRPWCRTTSEHFELITDLNPRRSAELLVSLDRFRGAAYALLPGRPATPAPVPRLVVFKRARDFVATFEFPNIGGFMQPSLTRSLLVFGPDRSGRHLSAFAFHEYTHFLLRSRATINLPIWYEEGLATYLANMTIDRDGTVTLGRGPHALLAFLLRSRQAPMAQLLEERFRLDWQRTDLANVYTLAWGLVRFLHHAERPGGGRYAEQLGAFLAAIDMGVPSAEALPASLGIAPEALPELMRGYFDSRAATTVFRYPLGDYQPPAHKRECLRRTEKALVLADAIAPHRPGEARRLYDDVLAAVPGHVDALLGRSRVAIDAAAARRDAAAAHAKAPEEAAANVQLARLMLADATRCETAEATASACQQQRAVAAAHYRQALAAAPDRADANYGLGVLELLEKRPAAAFSHLAAAHQRAPWSPRISYYLGEALRQQGELRRAAPYLRKTAAWHPAMIWRARANRALDAIGVALETPVRSADGGTRGPDGATSPPAAPE